MRLESASDIPTRSLNLYRNSLFFFVLIFASSWGAYALAQEASNPPAVSEKGQEDGTASVDKEEVDEQSLLDELTEEMNAEKDQWEVVEGVEAPSFPYVEHNGSFRFRADYFLRPHLGIAGLTSDGQTTITTSGMLPPLNQNFTNARNPDSQLSSEERSDDSIAGANIRLRYSPIIHVDNWLRIHSTVDILDNLVLGSTPDYAELRPDASFALFAGSQSPPSDGRNSVSDSIRVKEAFANVDTLLGNLRAGRMASHWGLGMLANGGKGLDADYGDYVDRVLFTTRLGSVYTALAWDFVSEGIIATDPAYAFGQAYDADQLDDVTEAVLAIFQRPMTDEEKAERQRVLFDARKPVFDWGIYTVFRAQKFDVSTESQPTYAPQVTNSQGYSTANTATSDNYDDFAFVKREGWGVIPDAWARFQWSPARGQLLRIETEWAMVIGEVENVNFIAGADPTLEPKDIEQWGGVLQTEYQASGNFSVFFESGIASGDDAEYFGVLDQVNYHVEGDNNQKAKNTKITNFKFDRGYYVDMLLFREAIGAVTNTYYFKPGLMYDLFDSKEDDLGFRFDILTAFAMEPEATPGNDPWYGIEFDTQLFYQERNRFRADLSWGTLVPGPAFDLIDGYLGAAGSQQVTDFAMTVQARMFVMF